MNGLVADGTLGPAAVAQRQVVQHAGPAEDVSAAGDACGQRRVQADGARRHLVTVDALQRSGGSTAVSEAMERQQFTQ